MLELEDGFHCLAICTFCCTLSELGLSPKLGSTVLHLVPLLVQHFVEGMEKMCTVHYLHCAHDTRHYGPSPRKYYSTCLTYAHE